MKRKEKLNKHLRKKYYKEDKKIISMKIANESELYNHLDALEETISSHITNYLEEVTETLLPLSEITISINCTSFCNLEKFKKALNLYYGIKILNVERYKKIETMKKTFLIFLACLSFLIMYFIHSTIVYTVASFIASLSIWELADMILFRDEEVIVKEFIYDILEDAKVIQEDK